MTDQFTTEYIPLSSLQGNSRNPKAHDIDLIETSIARFGIVDRITRDDRTGTLISGHGRARSLREMFERGEEAPEGIKVDADSGEWLVPVNTGWASKNDTEASAALIAMNRTSEVGGWVDESLLALLDEISNSDDRFDGVGFSETDLEDLRKLVEDTPDLTPFDSDPDDDDDSAKGSGAGSASVTVKLIDAGAIDAWHTLRDSYKTDDAAMRVLLGLDTASTHKKRTRKAKAASQPTAADLGPTDSAPTPSPVDKPVENSLTVLDWSTAEMVPESELEFSIDLSEEDVSTLANGDPA
jgi:hypothetical protein